MEKVKTMTIGIAGGSASGKTTLCNRLAEKLKNEEPKSSIWMNILSRKSCAPAHVP